MKLIGFWGYPDPKSVCKINSENPDCEWVDLDIDFERDDKNILPDAYCKIIKNVVNNAMFYGQKNIKIVATVGKDKCDSGWFAAQVLRDMGFDVLESKFEDVEILYEQKISTSNLPLYDKVARITGGIINRVEPVGLVKSVAGFGFWGVPPNDLEILRLFPDNTHLYGWTRCVEAGCPANIELEMFVDADIPTVFYSQAFCAKSQLAKYLADKYDGLYIDIDDYATNSVRAKIDAFLRLR